MDLIDDLKDLLIYFELLDTIEISENDYGSSRSSICLTIISNKAIGSLYSYMSFNRAKSRGASKQKMIDAENNFRKSLYLLKKWNLYRET